MNLNDQELNYIAGMINRALADGMTISVTEQEDDDESSTQQGDCLVQESRDRLALVEALHKAKMPLMVFQNNIGRNWIGTYSVVDMYMGANGKFVSDYSYEGYGIAGGERRMKLVVGDDQ